MDYITSKETVVVATGMYFSVPNTAECLKWAKTCHAADYADVRIKLDDIEKAFTFEDFKKRLGFK